MHQNQTKLNKLIAVLTPTIQPGQVIELTGLKSSLYNGQFGSIVASPNYDDLEQRYSVKLYSSQKTICLFVCTPANFVTLIQDLLI